MRHGNNTAAPDPTASANGRGGAEDSGGRGEGGRDLSGDLSGDGGEVEDVPVCLQVGACTCVHLCERVSASVTEKEDRHRDTETEKEENTMRMRMREGDAQEGNERKREKESEREYV